MPASASTLVAMTPSLRHRVPILSGATFAPVTYPECVMAQERNRAAEPEVVQDEVAIGGVCGAR
ncbi:hypothetical protein GTS_33130 [Gandjariella thermophila]|uniref:Uncharacterized protein n=1 Tax=Gandjariella thermophila TaxID=1931992 RepID=A0A4D4J9K4_9PSEU|nr:hypothetical protein GTS_33130 [Gandjariella thermophila]